MSIAENSVHLHADSEDPDQTGRMSRPILVFAGLMSFCLFHRSFSDAKTVTFQFNYIERQGTQHGPVTQ